MNLFKRFSRIALSLSILASGLSGIVLAQPASAVAATTCGVVTSSPGFAGGGVEITPLHGRAFYLDLKNGINATYIGYKVKNTSGSTKEDLWLELTNFRSSGTQVIGLANPADAYQPIGQLINNSTKVIYVLLKSNSYSVDDQTHDVRVHSGYPNGTSSILGATGGEGGAQCFYTFSKVDKTYSAVRTLAASANKVNSITVNTTTPVLGSTINVTIQGQTGQGGSGTVTPDGAIMWLSGASSSTWPTRALRLESTSISIKYKKTGGTTGNFTNQLILQNVNTSSTKFTSSTTYTAVFTFRVLGGSTSNPVIKPVAQIASGTQIKHTGKYPSTQTTVALASVTSNMISSKSVVSIGALETVTGVVYRAVNYRIVETDTAVQTSIDKIIDDPAAGVIYKLGTAKIRDSLRTSAAGTLITDPIDLVTAGDHQYTFGGPFKGYASGSSYVVELTYTMLLPTSSTSTYTNSAYALIGNTIVGSGSSTVGAAGVAVNGTSSAAVDPAVVSAAIPKQPQEIDFPAIPPLGVGSTYTLDAVATSGLPITYSSTTPSICSVVDGVLTILASGNCSVTASQAGDTFWDPAQNVSRTTTMLPGQLITFLPNGTMTVGSTQVKPATSDSGLPVTLTVLTPDICSVNVGTTPFTINGTTAGLCVIVASQAGGTIGGVTYGPAPDVERTIAIGVAQAILFNSLTNKNVNFSNYSIDATSKTPTTSGSNTLLPVTFTSKTPEVCEVTSDTSVSGGGSGGVSSVSLSATTSTVVGICIITASQDGFNSSDVQSAYSPAADVTQTFMVGTVPTIVVTTNVATIGSGGTITATTTITVPNTAGALRGTVTLYVDGTRATASAVQTTSINATLLANGTNANSYSVKAGILAPTDPNGNMVLTATFTKTSGDYGSTSTTSDVFVTVTPPEAPLATTNDVPASAVGVDTATITGIYTPRGGGTTANAVIYLGTSAGSLTDSTTAAAVSGNSAAGATPQTITTSATSLTTATKYFYKTSAVRDGYSADGVVKSFTTKPVAPTIGATTPGSTSVSVAFTPITPGAGVTINYRVICTATGGATFSVTGSSSPLTVSGLTVSTSGYTCTVAATTTTEGSGGGGYGAESFATAPFATGTAKSARTIEIRSKINGAADSATSITITYGDTASVIMINPVGDGVLSATKVSGAACSISGLEVSSEGVGTCFFNGAVSEGTTYSEAATTESTSVIVQKKVLTITASSSNSLVYGSGAPVISAGYSGFVKSENQNTAASFTLPTCTNGGYTNSSDAGTSFVTSCSGAAADNYSFIYVAGTVTVIKINQVISFDNPTNMYDTQTAQTLTVTVDSGLTPTLTSANSSICTVSGLNVSPVAAGTCQITSAQSGDTNRNPAVNVVKSFTITGSSTPAPATPTPTPTTPVVKQKPTLTWNNPDPIFVGTPLSGTQLNSILSVPGTCVYTPAAGTLLAAGTYTLSVTCTPTDGVNYEIVTTTVTIIVKALKKRPSILWFNPSSIFNPTPLGGTQLNAQGSTPGSLEYTPSAGTILEPGTYILKVKLKPNDPDFEELEARVTILVKSKPVDQTPGTPAAPVTPGAENKPEVKEPERPKTPVLQPDAVVVPGNKPVMTTAGKTDEVVTLKPNAASTGFVLAAEDWSISISSTTKFVKGNTADSSARVVIEAGNSITSSGTGFKPKSQVDVYVYSTPTWLGAVITDEFGNFTTTLPMPKSLPEGEHTFQAKGLTADDRQRAVSVPITLIPAVAKGGSLRFNVYFALNSPIVSKVEKVRITNLVKSAQKKISTGATIRIDVKGWVQPNANPGNIKFLSTNRANNVSNVLKSLGVKGKYNMMYPGLEKKNIPTSRRTSVVISWSTSTATT